MTRWKILLYMGWGGDAGFEAIQDKVLAQIAEVELEHVDVVYQFAREALVERGVIHRARRDVLATSPPITITDPHHLTRFLDWAGEMFPTRQTALFVKDHGQGPVDAHRMPVLTGAGILMDAKTKRYMPLPSFRRDIACSRAGRVDILGLDACRLGSVEAAYELREVTTVLMASEMTELTTGWAYPEIVKYLDGEHEVATPRDLALEVITSSTKFKLVAVEVAWLDKVARAIDALGLELGASAKKATLLEWVRTKFSNGYGEGIEVDKLVDELTGREDLCRAATLAAITSALASARVVTDPPPASPPGIGLFFPTTKGSASIAGYGAGAFASDTRWAEFVGTLNHWLMTTPP